MTDREREPAPREGQRRSSGRGETGVRFGLFMPQLKMSFETIAERARVAEALGYHSMWLMDHLAAPAAASADTLEGWTTASALASRTTELRLGHLVLCEAFRHPSLLAKMAATLDVISGGRLELGLGWGSIPDEMRRFGFDAGPSSTRAARLAETVEILEAMFTGEPVHYRGRFYELDGAVGRPRPVAGRVPLHIGGAGSRLTLPLVARYADWWNCPSYAVGRLGSLRNLAGEARISVQHPVGLASSSRARQETSEVARRRFGSWGGLITGTPDEVAAALSAEASLGAELFVLQFSDFAQPETLKLFAREVAPVVTASPRVAPPRSITP